MSHAIDIHRSIPSLSTSDRPTSWTPVLRFALVVSVLAALAAVAVTSAVEVSSTVVVVTVMVLAFAASWVRTFRTTG